MFIEMMFNETKLACGTAFYINHRDQVYLVSNWHNLSGLHPETKQVIHSKGGIPNRVKVYGHDMENLSIAKISTFTLRNDASKALWYEHPELGSSVDIGVLPIDTKEVGEAYSISAAIEDIDPFDDWPLEAGDQVFVLGFPFGISGSYYLPIWKSASLATEPGIDKDGLPLFYVDTATRKGMSGSPVVMYTRRPIVIREGEKMSRFRASFLGVYSGRIMPEDEMEAQLGRVWKARCIMKIIEGRKLASIQSLH